MRRGLLALGEHLVFVSLNLVPQLVFGDYALTCTVLVPNRGPRHGLELLGNDHLLGELVGVLQLLQAIPWLQQLEQQALFHGAHAGSPSADAVDGSVEEVHTDKNLVHTLGAANNLSSDVLDGILEQDNVVGVPMHGAGNVQWHVGEELQQAGQLVGNAFHGVEVASIDEHYMVAALLGSVGYVELLVAGGEAFNTDAEYLLLNRIDNMRGFEGIDLIEGILQACAQAISVGGVVLQAVGNPEVVQDHIVHCALRSGGRRCSDGSRNHARPFLGWKR